MGAQKTTQQTTIPGAGGQEAQLLALLSHLSNQFGGQFGDLSQLAKGNVGGPTEQDTNLVQQSIGRSGEMAQRELERILGPLMAQISEGSTGRGVQGSSMEQLSRILGQREISGRVADLIGNAQQQGGQALLNLPFQRGEMQLGANQALFQMLSGSANPVLANQLQSRMAQQKTTTTTPFNPMQLFSAAAGLGGLPFSFGGGGGNNQPVSTVPNNYRAY
jgi:hypothetical protein